MFKYFLQYTCGRRGAFHLFCSYSPRETLPPSSAAHLFILFKTFTLAEWNEFGTIYRA